MSVSRTRDLLGLVAFVVLCFGAATLGGVAVSSAAPGWYATLAKPSWTPPVFVFGPFLFQEIFKCLELRHVCVPQLDASPEERTGSS